jgi:hypothetical protein
MNLACFVKELHSEDGFTETLYSGSSGDFWDSSLVLCDMYAAHGSDNPPHPDFKL